MNACRIGYRRRRPGIKMTPDRRVKTKHAEQHKRLTEAAQPTDGTDVGRSRAAALVQFKARIDIHLNRRC